jgi:hypothetical protein
VAARLIVKCESASAVASPAKAKHYFVRVERQMVARRRQSTQKAVRGRVKLDASVERRLAQLSSMVNDLQRTLEVQSKRTAAIQAQMDHLDAKVRSRS